MDFQVLHTFRDEDLPYYCIDLVESSNFGEYRFSLSVRPQGTIERVAFDLENFAEGQRLLSLLRLALAAVWFLEQGGTWSEFQRLSRNAAR